MNARTLNLSAWLPASTVVGHGACCSSCAKNKPCESTCVGNQPQVGVPLYSYGNPYLPHPNIATPRDFRVGGIEEPRSDTKKVVLEVLAAVLAAVITVRVLGGKP